MQSSQLDQYFSDLEDFVEDLEYAIAEGPYVETLTSLEDVRDRLNDTVKSITAILDP